MTGTVELDADGAHLLIRFPYREDLVAAIRDVPGRRWDPKQKQWRVPCAQAELVYGVFARHQFEFAPEVTGLLAGTIAPATPRARNTPPPDRADADPAPTEALTISALNTAVRDALRGQFPQQFWIVGEVVDYDKQVDRAHRFFTLIEKAPGQGKVTARAAAVLFQSTAAMLQQRLAAKAPDFRLADGIEIRALVRVDFYVATGRFQVVVEDIDPSFTLGKLLLQREEILRELRAQDLLDRNRSLGVPLPPLRIGLLASPDSDGCSDFLRHLQESGIGFAVTLLPTAVQGAELRPTMLAGLRWFAAHAAEFDVLCIVRGGGSRTDLAWFDDLPLALAVARHPLKILVGIGHQRDQSVLDVIAHSEKTPTAVAAFLVRCVHDLRRVLQDSGRRLLTAARDLLLRARADLTADAALLQRTTAARLLRERTFLAHAARDLHGTALLRLERARSGLRETSLRAVRGAERRLEREAMRLEQQAARQRLLDPRCVLARGFALLRDDQGMVLPSVARIRVGQTLCIRLRDGEVRTHAEIVRPDDERA